MRIERIENKDWGARFSEYAHEICFNKKKPSEFDRIDYALLCIDDKIPVGYMTCRELDSTTVYWQFGGAFPNIKDTVKSYSALQAFVRWHQEKYKRIVTYVENDNTVYLKMLLRIGFLITGIRTYEGTVLLEHVLKFEGLEIGNS